MIGGTPRTRKSKPLDKQLMHPNAFCRQLDRLNPNHRFTIEQYCLAWEYAVNQIWGSKMFDLKVFREARPGMNKAEFEREMAKEKTRCIDSIRNEQLMTRAQRLVKHKETAMRKWEKAMKRGRTEDADLIALKLMKRYANAGEKLDDYLSQQLSLENQKIANLGLSLKKTKMTYLEGESRVPPMEKVDRDESVIIVYDVPRTASGHELIREGDALAFLKAKESEPFLTYNFWVRREYERGNGTVEFPATACVEFRESKE